MNRRSNWLILIAFFAGTSLWAIAEPTADELEQQRLRLVALRKDPEQAARLRDNLKAYLDLPEKRRTAIAKLDHDLSELSPKKQQRLANTLDRYADWLEQLREKDAAAYQAIKNAPDSATRLTLIKDRRDREWMELQPRVHREQWEKLQTAARSEFVTKLRQEERNRREQWRIARRFWREVETKQPLPHRLSDCSPKVREYVAEYLMPFLTAAEKKQLDDAEGRWPDYPQALVALASRRPSALPPPRKEDLPIHFAQLPLPIQASVSVFDKKTAKKRLVMQELKRFDGQPDFVSKVVEIGTKKGKQSFKFEFWASNRFGLEPPMRKFVEKQLIPKLDAKDKSDLQHFDFEGRWPYYPEAIRDLSRKHNLVPPWHYLPDPERYKWDAYRDSRAQSWGSEIAKEKEKKTP